MQLSLQKAAALATAILGMTCLVNCAGSGMAAQDSNQGQSEPQPNHFGIISDQNTGGTNSGNVSISSYVLPLSIEFFPANSNPSNDEYLFTLNLQTSAVENEAGTVVYTLTAAEQTQLAGIFAGSVYGSLSQLYEMQGLTPPPECELVTQNYAVINTTGESLALNGVCGAADLYNPNTDQNAGMESFLSTLKTEVEAAVGIGILGNGSNTQTVDLTATPSSGGAPLPVQFNATGLQSQYTYTIEFGDGTEQQLTLDYPPCASGLTCEPIGTASHTYQSAGSYTAELIQSGGINPCTCPTTGPCNCPSIPIDIVATVQITVDQVDPQ